MAARSATHICPLSGTRVTHATPQSLLSELCLPSQEMDRAASVVLGPHLHLLPTPHLLTSSHPLGLCLPREGGFHSGLGDHQGRATPQILPTHPHHNSDCVPFKAQPRGLLLQEVLCCLLLLTSCLFSTGLCQLQSWLKAAKLLQILLLLKFSAGPERDEGVCHPLYPQVGVLETGQLNWGEQGGLAQGSRLPDGRVLFCWPITSSDLGPISAWASRDALVMGGGCEAEWR
jgi:hypothetical protein